MYHTMTKLYAWQQDNWPNFTYDTSQLQKLEQQFSHLSTFAIGFQSALPKSKKDEMRIMFLSNEALGTSKIEGEILDRASLQSSVQRYFELKPPISKNHPKESGIAKMMVDLYQHYDEPLSHTMLFNWHRMVTNGRQDLEVIGGYRSGSLPMQIVSGPIGNHQVFYEAPPSKIVPGEMDVFITWFNGLSQHLPPIIRAGICHIYFERIHPFEDGNGRIGRALVEKSLAQSISQPTFIAISRTILKSRKDYYAAFEYDQKSNEINHWLNYFGNIIIDAQKHTIESMKFLVNKTSFYDQYANQLNERQHKLLNRIFQEDIKGFTGGVSVKNYMSINKNISRLTANRDLNSLVDKGIMKRIGDRKSTRYWLVDSIY